MIIDNWKDLQKHKEIADGAGVFLVDLLNNNLTNEERERIGDKIQLQPQKDMATSIINQEENNMNNEEIKIQLKKVQDHLDNGIKIAREYIDSVRADLQKGIPPQKDLVDQLIELGGFGSKEHADIVDMYINYLDAFNIKYTSLDRDIKKLDKEINLFCKKTVNSNQDLMDLVKTLSKITNVPAEKILNKKMTPQEHEKVFKVWQESLKRTNKLPKEE